MGKVQRLEPCELVPAKWWGYGKLQYRNWMKI